MSPAPAAAARRALVTGASSGIGAATACLLAGQGYRVALLARREEPLQALVRGLPRPDEHLALACDVADAQAVRQACARVASAFGALDLLVNNAGSGYRARVEELEPALVRRLLDTNVLGVLLCCREALPLLRRGRASVVVNVASVVGRRGIPGQAAYAASKAAVCSIGEALRLEWAQEGIAVCTLDPALTATGFFEVQPNPAGLADPDLSRSDQASDVARHVLELDRRPRPELFLRRKWHWLACLSLLAPRLSDRILAARLGGGWKAPAR